MEKEKRRPPTSELEALQKIDERGGGIGYRTLGAEMGFGSHYMSVICRALGNADYIDFKATGICILTPKGREELGRKGLLKEEETENREIKQVEKPGFANPGMEETPKSFPTQTPQIPTEAVPLNDVELEALKALGQSGGRMAGRNLATRVGHSYDYMDRYYRTLGHADLIDYVGSGVCVLTPKGKELLRKMGWLA